MFKSLYYSTALALLPSAEAVTRQFEGLVKKLDTVTVHLEGYLEEKAVALAMNSMKHRTAMDRVHAFLDAAENLVERLIDSVHSAFERREKAIIDDITSLRQKLDKASEARDAVEKLLGR